MHSSVYFNKINVSTVEIQCGQQSKPWKSAWSTLKCQKELVKVCHSRDYRGYGSDTSCYAS